jgi:thioredoxin reductase
VESIVPREHGFDITTSQRSLQAKAVLLTIGRRGSPRKLGIPGEDLSKVVYRLIEPQQYRGQRVLVVGGGDSALEAAASLAEEADALVSLAYRGNAIGRAKPKNRERIKACAAAKTLDLWFSTGIAAITEDHVILSRDGEEHRIANDAVIVCAGGVLPTELLKRAGVEIATKYGTA